VHVKHAQICIHLADGHKTALHKWDPVVHVSFFWSLGIGALSALLPTQAPCLVLSCLQSCPIQGPMFCHILSPVLSYSGPHVLSYPVSSPVLFRAPCPVLSCSVLSCPMQSSQYLNKNDQESAVDTAHALDHAIAFVLFQYMTKTSEFQHPVKQPVLVDGQDDQIEQEDHQCQF